MSTLFKNSPGTFAEYENRNSPAPDILRGDHLVVVTIDRLLALQAAFKRWRKRRKTLRALADLDDRQLRDIGLTRDDRHYHALAEHEDVRTDYLRHKRKERARSAHGAFPSWRACGREHGYK